VATISKRTRKKGTVWQVKIRRQGRMQSASFSTKKQAEDWSRNIENSIEMEKYFPNSQPQKSAEHTVDELLDIYQDRIVNHHSEGTKGTYGRCLQYWRRAIGDCLVKNVTPALLEDCRYYLLNEKHLDAQTVNLYMFSLRPAFNYAASESLNWITRNPFTRIKKLREKPGRAPQLTDQQVQDLLTWCDRSQSKYLWLYVRLLLCTGARKQEIMQATWGQISLRRGTITFIKTKSRQQRTIPLPSYMVDILKHQYEQRFGDDAGLMNFPEAEYLFPSPKNPRKPVVNLHLAYGKARDKAGLSDTRFHDIRHHYASRMIIDGGSDILAVSVLLGHSNLKQTARYAHLTHGHIAAQVEQMASKVFQKKA